MANTRKKAIKYNKNKDKNQKPERWCDFQGESTIGSVSQTCRSKSPIPYASGINILKIKGTASSNRRSRTKIQDCKKLI